MRRALIGSLILSALALSAAPSLASAQERAAPFDAVGNVGVGFTRYQAPLGIRMWVQPTIGFDANVGLSAFNRVPDVEGDPGDETTVANFDLDLGVLFAVWKKSGSQSIAFVRGGLYVDRDYANAYTPPGGDDDDAVPTTNQAGNLIHSDETRWNFNLLFGVEYFLTELGLPQLALQGALGVNFALISPPEVGGEADLRWELTSVSNNSGDDFDPLSIVNATFGFHYYFF